MWSTETRITSGAGASDTGLNLRPTAGRENRDESFFVWVDANRDFTVCILELWHLTIDCACNIKVTTESHIFEVFAS